VEIPEGDSLEGEAPGTDESTEAPDIEIEVPDEESLEVEALAAGSMEAPETVGEAPGEREIELEGSVADEIGELSELAEEDEFDVESTMVLAPGREKLATPTMAEIYVQQGHIEKAIEVYRRVLDGDQDNQAVVRRIGELERLARGDGEGAEEVEGIEALPDAGEGAEEDNLTRRKIRALELWLERIQRLRENP